MSTFARAYIEDELIIDGGMTVNETLYSNDINSSGSIVTPSMTASSQITTDQLTIEGALTVSGASDLQSNVSVESGGLTVSGVGTNSFKDTLDVSQNATLTNGLVANSDVTVSSGGLFVTGAGTVSLIGTASFSDALNVNNNLSLTSNFNTDVLTASGNATFGVLSAGGSLTVDGGLTINGTAANIQTDELSITDPIIELARGNAGDSLNVGIISQYNNTQFSGIVRYHVDGEYYLIDDSTNTGNMDDVSGDKLSNLNVDVLGAATGTFKGDVSVDGSGFNVTSDLSVGGTSDFNGKMTVNSNFDLEQQSVQPSTAADAGVVYFGTGPSSTTQLLFLTPDNNVNELSKPTGNLGQLEYEVTQFSIPVFSSTGGDVLTATNVTITDLNNMNINGSTSLLVENGLTSTGAFTTQTGTFNSAISVGGATNVSGTSTLSSTLNVDGAMSLATATINNTLVAGAVTLNNTLDVTNESSLGDVTVNSSLGVSGTATFEGQLTQNSSISSYEVVPDSNLLYEFSTTAAAETLSSALTEVNLGISDDGVNLIIGRHRHGQSISSIKIYKNTGSGYVEQDSINKAGSSISFGGNGLILANNNNTIITSESNQFVTTGGNSSQLEFYRLSGSNDWQSRNYVFTGDGGVGYGVSISNYPVPGTISSNANGIDITNDEEYVVCSKIQTFIASGSPPFTFKEGSFFVLKYNSTNEKYEQVMNTGSANPGFGNIVKISPEGTFIATSLNDTTGIQIYKKNGETWDVNQTLTTTGTHKMSFDISENTIAIATDPGGAGDGNAADIEIWDYSGTWSKTHTINFASPDRIFTGMSMIISTSGDYITFNDGSTTENMRTLIYKRDDNGTTWSENQIIDLNSFGDNPQAASHGITLSNNSKYFAISPAKFNGGLLQRSYVYANVFPESSTVTSSLNVNDNLNLKIQLDSDINDQTVVNNHIGIYPKTGPGDGDLHVLFATGASGELKLLTSFTENLTSTGAAEQFGIVSFDNTAGTLIKSNSIKIENDNITGANNIGFSNDLTVNGRLIENSSDVTTSTYQIVNTDRNLFVKMESVVTLPLLSDINLGKRLYIANIGGGFTATIQPTGTDVINDMGGDPIELTEDYEHVNLLGYYSGGTGAWIMTV